MTALGALALLIAGLTAVSGQPYSRLGSIVAGGGGTGGNGQYSLSGTAGQAVTGAQTDGHFTLLGGFWSFVASNQASPPVLLNPILWTNKAGGHWNVASNWSPNQTPGPGDTAMLNGGYSCTVTVDDATTVGNLTLGAGVTLAGPGKLTVNGSLNWTGGNLTGWLQCNGGAVSGSAAHYQYGGQLVNAGTLTLNASITTGYAAGITNLPGAVFDLTSDVGITYYTGARGAIYNQGTFRKSGGLGVSALTEPFSNTGTVDVETGTLSLGFGGNGSGLFQATSGATLAFGNPATQSGSTFTLAPGANVSGAGALLVCGGTANLAGTVNLTGSHTFSAGTATLSGPYWMTNGILTISGGAANFTGTGLITPAQLELSAGVLGGTTLVMVTGPLHWTGGNLTGWLQCNGGTVIGSAGHYQYGGQLVNAGTLTLNSSITTGYAAAITNLPGAVFDLAADVGISYYTGVRGAIYNQGAFRKSGGLGVSTLTEPFSNAGTVDVQTGTLSLGFGGNGSGLFQAASGATLAFGNPASLSGSTFNLALGATVSGAGGLLVCGGTANLAGTVNLTGNHTFSAGAATLSGPYWMTNGILTVSGGAANFTGTGRVTPAQLELSAGVLGGTTPVVATGPLHWTGGNLTGWLQCNGGAVSGGGAHYQYGGQLVNAGTLTLNASITTGYAAAITNLPGAVFDLAADVGISYYTGVRGAIYNQGAFRKSGGLGVSTLTEPFSNTGTVDIETGALSLGFGGNGSGLFQAASGATLAFGNPASQSGSTFTLAAGATASGAGALLVCGGTANLAGTVNLTGSHTFSAGTATLSGPYWMTNGILTISGGTANFTGTGLITPAQLELSAGVLGGTTPVVVTGPLHWTGGNLTGWLQCNGGAVSGSAGHYQYGGQLVNAGTLTLNASITTGYAAGITNLPGAVFDLAADVGISYYTGVRGAIYNQGAFRKSGGLGVSVLTEPFSNAGALEARSGTLEFGQLLTQTAGQTWLLEGRLTVGHGLALVGGMLAGTNTLTGNVTNSGGMVSPGASAGVLTIAGHYAQTSGGTLRIELGGPTPGSGFDQLAVSGTATLGGALDVSFIQGFTPPANSAYNFLMAGSRAGVFASFSPPLAQLGLTLDYATNGATLGVTGLSSPTISLPWLTNKTLVLFWPSSAASYQLEAALDLLRGPSWVVIPSSLYQTNGETIQYVEPVAATGGRFFRLRKTAPSGP